MIRHTKKKSVHLHIIMQNTFSVSVCFALFPDLSSVRVHSNAFIHPHRRRNLRGNLGHVPPLQAVRRGNLCDRFCSE